jgi:hypothetical protein
MIIGDDKFIRKDYQIVFLLQLNVIDMQSLWVSGEQQYHGQLNYTRIDELKITY